MVLVRARRVGGVAGHPPSPRRAWSLGRARQGPGRRRAARTWRAGSMLLLSESMDRSPIRLLARHELAGARDHVARAVVRSHPDRGQGARRARSAPVVEERP